MDVNIKAAWITVAGTVIVAIIAGMFSLYQYSKSSNGKTQYSVTHGPQSPIINVPVDFNGDININYGIPQSIIDEWEKKLKQNKIKDENQEKKIQELANKYADLLNDLSKLSHEGKFSQKTYNKIYSGKFREAEIELDMSYKDYMKSGNLSAAEVIANDIKILKELQLKDVSSNFHDEESNGSIENPREQPPSETAGTPKNPSIKFSRAVPIIYPSFPEEKATQLATEAGIYLTDAISRIFFAIEQVGKNEILSANDFLEKAEERVIMAIDRYKHIRNIIEPRRINEIRILSAYERVSYLLKIYGLEEPRDFRSATELALNELIIFRKSISEAKFRRLSDSRETWFRLFEAIKRVVDLFGVISDICHYEKS